MSLFTDASLVYVPSGVKDGKTYSITPTDGSGDLTFSRGSDIEATRVAANGYIEKAQVNLLLQSNSFNTTWTTVNATLTSGQTGYDGSSDAWLLTDDTFDGSHDIRQSSVSFTGLKTLSVYAKAGTNNFLKIFTGVSTTYFNLSTGAVGTNGHDGASMTSVGGGWYRCSLFDTDTFTFVLIGTAVTDNVPNYAGTGGNIYIQDAQVNYGLVAQTYQETTAAAVVSGITDNMPRLNYDPANPTCPSLLLEPSRTNHYYKSEYFSTGSRVILTQNAVISPEGVSNGTSVVATSVLGSHEVTLVPLISIANTNPRAFSVYAKYNGNHLILNAAGSSTSWTACIFDLQNGVAKTPQNNGSQTACTADIQDAGGGWYRCSITYTPYASGGFYNLISLTDDVNATLPTSNFGADNYTGDDVSGIYIYGAQVEEGSYPTSYIPCYGSSATRTDEVCDKTGIASLIGQTEGTIFIQVESNEHISELSDGTSTNRIVFYTDGSDYLRNLIRSGGSTSSNIQTNTTIQAGDKIAMAYANNDSVIYKNGVQIGSDTTVTVPATSKVNVGSDYNGGLSSINSVNQFIVFPTRLPNSDLATLTSL